MAESKPLQKRAPSQLSCSYAILRDVIADRDQFFEGKASLSVLLPSLTECGVVTSKQEERLEKVQKKSEKEAKRKLFHFVTQPKKMEGSAEHEKRLLGFLDVLCTTSYIPEHKALYDSIHEGITTATVETESQKESNKEHQGFQPIYTCTNPCGPCFATFTASGGTLYCPYRGVTVYVPSGAVSAKKTVMITFFNVTGRESLYSLRSFFPGSILCSRVFEFEAKIVNSEDKDNELTTFLEDVWIELPHCIEIPHFHSSEKYIPCVLSEKNGKVQTELSAIFSPGYPYVNIPVRHFTRFAAVLRPHRKFPPKGAIKRSSVFSSPRVRHSIIGKTLPQELEGSQSSRTSSCPTSKQVQTLVQGTLHSPQSSPITTRAQSDDPTPLSQPVTQSGRDELVMGSYSTLQLDLENSQDTSGDNSLKLLLCLLQPRNRSQLARWKANIVLLQDFPGVYGMLRSVAVDTQKESRIKMFKWTPSSDVVCLSSNAPIPGWMVEFDRMQILIDEITAASSECPLSLDQLPMSEPTIVNQRAIENLDHGVTVGDSVPPATCYLTCDVTMVTRRHAVTETFPDGTYIYHSSSSEGHQQYDPSIVRDSPPSRVVDMLVDWNMDRLVFVVTALLLPDSQLVTMGRKLRLTEVQIEQIASSGYSEVGEKMYQMFVAANQRCELNNFGQFLTNLCDPAVPINQEAIKFVRLYLIEFKPLHSGRRDMPIVEFLKWTLEHTGNGQMSEDILWCGESWKISEHRFIMEGLSDRITLLWKMFGRLCGLTDNKIHQICVDNPLGLRGGARERCYRTLLDLSQEFPFLSFRTIMMALEVIGVHSMAGTNDAFFYISNCITSVTL